MNISERNAISQAIGSISVCWDPQPTGSFLFERAGEITKELYQKLDVLRTSDIPGKDGRSLILALKDHDFYEAWKQQLAETIAQEISNSLQNELSPANLIYMEIKPICLKGAGKFLDFLIGN